MDPLPIRPGIVIPASELSASFTRSGGPGGQNVNKVSTRVTLRFALAASGALPPAVKERLRRLARGRLTRTGDVVLSSQRYREQARNLDDCREKLRELVLRALVRPRRRRATAPPRRAVERRLEAKARLGEKKRARRVPSGEGQER